MTLGSTSELEAQTIECGIEHYLLSEWIFHIPECGRTLQGPIGRLSAAEFEIDGLCEWRITATHGERIQLNITQMDIFETENCETDYVEVRDGYWHQSDLIGELDLDATEFFHWDRRHGEKLYL